MNAIDTNVLIYTVDAQEPAKQLRSKELITQLLAEPVELVAPWQVAVEFLACLRRWENQRRSTRSETELYLAHLVSTIPLITPKPIVLNEALSLSSRHSLSHWDSMLLAAAIEAGVTTLYSEDMTDGAVYDSIKVINPFA